MEHVEVLRDLSEVCRAAIKAGDWKVDGACDPDAALRRADAAIASLSAPKPEGEWVLVPREPTPEMVQASDDISCRAEGAEHWAAMLAAAPQPPAQLVSIPKSSPNGWLQAGGLLYRLTEGRRPQNRDEINVTMVHGSRDPAHCEARASEILAMLQAPHPPAEAQAQGGGEVAMEAWHAAVNDAGELRSNAPDERYARRAANVESWIKANRPAPPSAPVGVEVLRDLRDRVLPAALRHHASGPGYIEEAQEIVCRALAQQPAAVDEMGELVGLLDEVRSHFTRDDHLPDDLLPRIDAALAAQQGDSHD